MGHARHIVAAGLVLSSPPGRILMVQTFNRIGTGFILPGGLVEAGEAPATAAAREVAEELGLELSADRLLAVEHQAEAGGRPSSLQFVFSHDRTVDEHLRLTLQPDEIAEAHWIDRDHVAQRHGVTGQARMEAALHALDSGVPRYLAT